MVKTTRAQRVALKAVFDRVPLFIYDEHPNVLVGVAADHDKKFAVYAGSAATRLTYQQFRRRVQPTFGMDSAVVVQWCGMWLAIEADGYVHS